MKRLTTCVGRLAVLVGLMAPFGCVVVGTCLGYRYLLLGWLLLVGLSALWFFVAKRQVREVAGGRDVQE